MSEKPTYKREAGPPISSLDFSPNTRRSSSRASQRVARVSGLNTALLPKTSYSLPPTPIASSFEDSTPSAKRRKTPRSINNDDHSVHSQVTVETPDQRSRSASVQASSTKSKKSNRNRKSSKTNHVTQDKQEPSQSTLHRFISHQSPDRPKSPTAQSELSETKPVTTSRNSSVMKTRATNPKSRNSMPAKANGASDAEMPGTQASSRASTPQTTRSRNRKPKPTVHTARTTPNVRSQPISATDSSKPQTPTNGLNKSPVSTPGSLTAKTRRRGPTSGVAASAAHQNDEQSYVTPDGNGTGAHSQGTIRRSNTVKLNVGRKALAAALSTPLAHPYDREMANGTGEEVPKHVYDDGFHFDYDAEMYGRNFGLDGQMEPPGSPTSLTTSTSTANRASGRVRKPTIRALESQASEQRVRRRTTPRAKPKPSATSKVVSQAAADSKVTSNPTPNSAAPQRTPVVLSAEARALANRLLDFAATAVAEDFKPEPQAGAWLQEMRKQFDAEQTAGQVAEDAGRPGEQRKQQPPPPNTTPSASAPTRRNRTRAQAKREAVDSVVCADADGWRFTGQVNEFGEELFAVGPEYEVFRPNNTYNDDELPQPPLRYKARDQVERDRIFGYPPRMGERNLPQETAAPFRVEDVNTELAKIKLREEAKSLGIAVGRTWNLNDIEAAIATHRNGTAQTPAVPTPVNGNISEKATRASRKRRRETTDAVIATPEDAPALKAAPKTGGRLKVTSKTTATSKANPKTAATSEVSPKTAATPKATPKTAVTPKATLKSTPASKASTKSVAKSKTPLKATATSEAVEPRQRAKRRRKNDEAPTAPAAQETSEPDSEPEPAPAPEVQGDGKRPLRLTLFMKDQKGVNDGNEKGDDDNGDEDTPEPEPQTQETPKKRKRVKTPKSSTSDKPSKSKKRARAEVDETEEDKATSRPHKSPKNSTSDTPSGLKVKLRTSGNKEETDDKAQDETKKEFPETPETPVPAEPVVEDETLGETPGGRPRRRAAAALMAGFQTHAKERARRAARRKGSENPEDEATAAAV
ncbi:hypothetical protein BDW42DRAFT_177665 [Aspergillus taichungensis]|uniref:GPI-anchored cell surface glycoprotein n=1 Tax=Aspergillus taichungensis TaxID=482145 RepID=A0A2J5HIX6_9EURO|nr:hypothetical protein BDW42DRAFT_177665 [Aspergillus taichungensis]